MAKLSRTSLLLCFLSSPAILFGQSNTESSFGPEQMKQVTRLFSRLATFGPGKFALRDGVSEELNLSNEQIAKLRDLQRESSVRHLASKFQKEIGSLEHASPDQIEDTIEDLEEAAILVNNDAQETVEEILTEEQSKRLAELQFQHAISEGNIDGALATSGVKVARKNKAALEAAIAQANIRIDEQVAKLRRDSYLEAIRPIVGPRDVELLTGEPFDFPSKRRRGKPYSEIGLKKRVD